MSTLRTISGLAISSLAAVLWGTGQGVFAHTTIRDQATEGKTAYNAVEIERGCGPWAHGG